MEDFKKEVEAILFSAGRAVLIQEFQLLLNLKNPGMIRETIKELKEEYVGRDSPLMIVEEGEGWKLTVKEKYLQVVQRINPHTELSKTVLETLSVIAWKQPALQSDVIRIRTNKAYDHIAELERLGFVAKDKFGRSFTLKVTQKFLDYFDLPDSKAIKDTFKDFKEIESAVQKKVDEFDKDRLAAENVPTQSLVENQETASPGVVTFTDELPPMPMPKTHSDLEIYERAPEEVKKEEKADLKREEIKTEQQVKKVEQSKKATTKVETAEEKARRIARELLAEDLPKTQEASEEERSLHPKLEEFIAGTAKKSKRSIPDKVIEQKQDDNDSETDLESS
jgi:segregation and condensation protein B